MNLKVGDKVIVIAGKDKGKEGKIIAKKGDKVLVEGINMVKRHVKPNGQDQNGGIVDNSVITLKGNNITALFGKSVNAPSTVARVNYTLTENIFSTDEYGNTDGHNYNTIQFKDAVVTLGIFDYATDGKGTDIYTNYKFTNLISRLYQ